MAVNIIQIAAKMTAAGFLRGCKDAWLWRPLWRLRDAQNRRKLDRSVLAAATRRQYWRNREEDQKFQKRMPWPRRRKLGFLEGYDGPQPRIGSHWTEMIEKYAMANDGMRGRCSNDSLLR